MKRFPTLGLMTALGFVAFSPAKASAQDASAILEKAIKALGGEEKLTRASAHYRTGHALAMRLDGGRFGERA